ncbi:hypothetical protein [Kordiimonas sp.]|uniref:hypothetical protein n=1 Tax=Kordiimonas sp. TaxID=1970157 RepID=UPI003A8EEF8A
MTYPKLQNEQSFSFKTGNKKVQRVYALDGAGTTKTYLWAYDAVTDATTLSEDGGDAVAVASIYDGDDIAATIAAIVTPKTLSKVAFMDAAYPLLGSGLTGVQRYGEVLTQAKASASPLVVAAMERYTHATAFERDDVATFLDILVSDPGVDLTQGERDAIVNGWPDETGA